jgi:predicted dinucleotide-binding enzyme
MKIGVLGSGEVAQTLAAGFAKHGHAVTIGSRSPAKLTQWLKAHATVQGGTFSDAARYGEVVVLAVKGIAAAEALRLAGAAALTGKIVIDACNPITDDPPLNGVLKMFTTPDESLMERLQHEFSGARFVKAFSSVGAGLMINPTFKEGGRGTMFICGNDAAAKKTVGGFCAQFGWDVADVGKCESARAIEPLAMLWCLPGILNNEWNHAFKLVFA